jgi:MinD-like ATPase involved in chromosome partitioning or flagellar assembly
MLVARAVSESCLRFDYVIVDTHRTLDERNLRILEFGDLVLVVCTPEIQTILHTHRLLKLARSLGHTDRLNKTGGSRFAPTR